jgi:hypothetical protein
LNRQIRTPISTNFRQSIRKDCRFFIKKWGSEKKNS